MSKEIKIRIWDTVEKKMEPDPIILSQDRYKHLLYSGETDRDGKEIYDGDLIKIGAEPGTYGVRWHAACFLVYEGEKQIGLLGELQTCFLKVIGNIYER